MAVLRTSIGDSKLPDVLLNVIDKDPDNRVIVMALKVMVNMVRRNTLSRSSFTY